MKFTRSVILSVLTSSVLASPAILGTLKAATLFGRTESACCQYEVCVNNCENGFGSNPIGEAGCIESCASTTGTGGAACFCCANGVQQPGSNANSACTNDGGPDPNIDPVNNDCPCPT